MPFRIVRNDITKVTAEIIVNITNSEPEVRCGTDFAIYRAVGKEGEEKLLRERKKIGKIFEGNIEVTKAFNLNAKYIIHTVAPIWEDGKQGKFEILENWYRESLEKAVELKCESIAFPLIATGMSGFPKDQALEIAVSTFRNFLFEHDIEIILVIYDDKTFQLSKKILNKINEYIKAHYVEDGNRNLKSGENQNCLERKYDYIGILELIATSNMKNKDICREANIDQKLFSKIKCNKNYHPKKKTVMSLCIALKLDLEQSKDLLAKAGFTFDLSSKFDLIVQMAIENKEYNICKLNTELEYYTKDTLDKKNKSTITLYKDKYHIKDEGEIKQVEYRKKQLEELPNFPFKYMSEFEKIKLLHYTMIGLEGRQTLANLRKNKVDFKKSFIEFIYRNNINSEMGNIEKELEKFLDKNMDNIPIKSIEDRRLIRFSNMSENDLLKYLYIKNKEINNTVYQNEEEAKVMCKIMGLNFDDKYTYFDDKYTYLFNYIDYVANVILQFFIYKIILNPNIDTVEITKKLMCKIKELSICLNRQLYEKKKMWEKAEKSNLDVLKVTKCYAYYSFQKAEFYEEYEIKKTLQESMKEKRNLFNNISPKYKAEKILIDENKIKDIKEIVTEGKKVRNYAERMKVVRKFINIMRDYGNRDAHSLCLQDLKVYYREIFVTKENYNRKQAYRIVKEYLKKFENAKENNKKIPEFDKQSQYMFVREKISRGYFRELNYSKEYIQKIDIEKELYDLLLKTYLFYDFQDSLDFIYEINRVLLEELMQIFA